MYSFDKTIHDIFVREARMREKAGVEHNINMKFTFCHCHDLEIDRRDLSE